MNCMVNKMCVNPYESVKKEVTGYISDHEYCGNICSGFGGVLECDYIYEDGYRCGATPFRHVNENTEANLLDNIFVI